MTFVHPLLLGGLLLVGVPVLIHMIMRQKPKRLRFPALRFLQQRYITNSRRLRLRHWLLLALRMGLIAAVCLAFAQPGGRPVAVVLIFDTSYSMEYTIAGQTRLARAQKLAGELLDALPKRSRVAVLDTAELAADWLPSVQQAREKVARLELNHAKPRLRRANGTVTQAIRQTYQRLFAKLAEEGDAGTAPKQVYIFSDRTQACWDQADVRELTAPEQVQAVFVDVGVDAPRDVAISRVEMPRRPINPGEPIRIPVTVQATGAEQDEREVELRFRVKPVQGRGEPEWERRSVRLRGSESREVAFERRAASRPGTREPVPGLDPGWYQVDAELGISDALPFDNVGFGTFRIREPRRALVLTDRKEEGHPGAAHYWRFDLEYLRMFQCEVKDTADTAALRLENLDVYDLICLVDVADPARHGLWAKLQEYVKKGRGLMVVPGGEGWEPRLDDYNKGPGAVLMPAELKSPAHVGREESGIAWEEQLPEHPLLEPFRQWRRIDKVDFQLPEGLPRASSYWEAQPHTEEAKEESAPARVIIRYANSQQSPALVERAYGRGKVLLFTTAFDGRRDPFLREWNNYAQTSFSRVLINVAASYLAGDLEQVEPGYPAGQLVRIAVPPGSRSLKYTLSGPGLDEAGTLLERTPDQQTLDIDQAVTPGNFFVFDPERSRVIAAFSIHARPEECRLARVPAEEVQRLLGPTALVSLAEGGNLRDALQDRWPQPIEWFFWLLVLVLLLLAVENLLANKFYRRSGEPTETPAPAPGAGTVAQPPVKEQEAVAMSAR